MQFQEEKIKFSSFKFDLMEIVRRISKTIKNSGYSQYVNQFSGPNYRIELLDVVGQSHRLRIYFDVWYAVDIHELPTKIDAERILQDLEVLVKRLNVNMEKWLREVDWYDCLDDKSHSQFGVFDEAPTKVALESFYWTDVTLILY